jgi:hypothetical protein
MRRLVHTSQFAVPGSPAELVAEVESPDHLCFGVHSYAAAK